jgi:hypothetical protein
MCEVSDANSVFPGGSEILLESKMKWLCMKQEQATVHAFLLQGLCFSGSYAQAIVSSWFWILKSHRVHIDLFVGRYPTLLVNLQA